MVIVVTGPAQTDSSLEFVKCFGFIPSSLDQIVVVVEPLNVIHEACINFSG